MSLTHPSALFIDLDDTLITYSAVVPEAWAGAIRDHCAEAGFESADAMYAAIHAKSSWYWSDANRHREGRLALRETRRIIVAAALEEAGKPDPELARKVADRFSALREELIVPFPGAIDTLGTLRESGIGMVMITNGQAVLQRGKIDRHGLARFFDHIIVEEEFGAGKPDPAVYRHALSLARVAPEEAWMVGDNLEWDIRGAQAVGIAGIWNDFALKGLEAGAGVRPDAIIRSFPEILGLIAAARR